MKHIVVAITARASLARVQTVIEALHSRCQLTVVVAGSAVHPKYGRVTDEQVFADLSIEYIECVGVEPHGFDGAAAYTGQLITELTTVFALLDPDLVVVVADRYETLAVSIAASYLQIPLCHLLGGERSGNIDDKVRFANTALADIHCAPTAEAYRNLYQFSKNVHLTGCPSVDLAVRAQLPSADLLNMTGIGPEFEADRPYVVALYHPCFDDDFTPQELFDVVYATTRKTGHQLLWFWPNIDPGAEFIEKELRDEHENESQVRFYRHLPAEQFLGLLRTAACLVGNSSVGVREVGVFGTPVVDIGARQAGRLTTCNVLQPAFENLGAAIQQQISTKGYPLDYTYGRGDAGRAIAEVLLAQNS